MPDEELTLPWEAEETTGSEAPEAAGADAGYAAGGAGGDAGRRSARGAAGKGARGAGARKSQGAAAKKARVSARTAEDRDEPGAGAVEPEAGGPVTDGVAPEPREEVLTVSEVNRLAKRHLEALDVTVQGEVSKLTTGYAYYVYFDLRDADATLPAILTQNQLKALGFRLEEGSSVVVRGTLSLYERQGKYQVRVTSVEPYGEGDIQRRIEALKKKLHSEGLFDDSLKKPLPGYPGRIGLVTSPSGAAVRDVIVTLGRRFPPARVFLRGVRVQGTSAVPQICSALDFFDSRWPVDVVILARGGGSLQDLEPFNSEEVARAIAAMRTPVVSGIGHEPDVTVADLVADRRASTPTGAAEAVVPDRAEVSAYLDGVAGALRRREAGELKARAARLAGLRSRPLYRGPEYVMGPAKQRWERAAASLPGSPARGLARAVQRLAVVSRRPVFSRAAALLAGRVAEARSAKGGLVQAGPRAVEEHSRALKTARARLDALSPLAVLERGYSITFRRDTGAVVRSSAEVETGDALTVRLGRGTVDAEITGKE